MLFSIKLEKEIYSPWKDQYINYEKLKKLLKENVIYQASDDDNSNKKNRWSEQNESEFVHQLDLELEKVYSFQSSEYRKIDNKISNLENLIDTNITDNSDFNKFLASFDYKQFQNDLEDTLSLAKELDHFARLNFTGFVKIVKKHDRLHPDYTVKPLLNVRLNELPFHSEDYSPLLYRISVLYNFLRENFSNKITSSSVNSLTLNSVSSNKAISTDSSVNKSFKSFKFWIHPDNLMEVKTKILRHLPVLIYDNSFNNDGDLSENDAIVTSLYFDNSNFDLYNSKLQKNNNSPTVRLRWSGRLIEKPDIFLERKLFHDDTAANVDTDNDEKLISIQLKEKYINNFIFNNDTNSINKIVNKMVKRGDDSQSIKKFKANLVKLQNSITENELEPTLRCIYTRTAFQIPGDDRVRIVIDSDILFIREDSFDKYRPIRDPQQWHRTDIDSKIDNPYVLLRKGEYTKFPYSVMEITVQNQPGNIKETTNNAQVSSSSLQSNTNNKISLSFTRKSGKWIEELTSSHLVKEVPNFSKFIQGIASLYTEDDKLDILPFWLPELEKDIRKDPQEAYDEELKKLQKRKQSISLINKINNFSPSLSPIGGDQKKLISKQLRSKGSLLGPDADADLEDYDSSDNDDDVLQDGLDDDGEEEDEEELFSDEEALGRLASSSQPPSSIITNQNRFENTALQSHRPSRLLDVESEDEEVVLPPGVKEPKNYIKNAGPVKVEAKVWLANERTYLRWLHSAVILFLFSTSIQASSYKSNFPVLSETISTVYFLITIFTLGWGYYIYRKRLNVIERREGDHLDNIFGPLVIAVSLTFVLVINFTYGVKKSLVHHELQNSFKTMDDGVAKEYFKFFVNLVGGDIELVA